MLKAAKYGAFALAGGALAGAVMRNPKTQKGEHAANNFSTAVSLGTIAATPYVVKNLVNKNPKFVVKVGHETGKAIENASKYAVKYGKKATDYAKNVLQGEKCSKVASALKNVYSKFINSNVGKNIKSKVASAFNKTKSNATVQKYGAKLTEALEKFAKSSTTKKGLIGLAAAGTALLVYAGVKTITNHYRKDGAIDQKYDDLHKKYERMIDVFPITSAKTGEPISFEEFCKYSHTYLK